MKSNFLRLITSIVLLSSCSTAYRTGQTPDDVYYSPARTYEEERETTRERRENRRRELANERNIRMGIYDPRWRYFDNDFYYSPYHFGFNTGFYYNPFYWSLPVYNPIIINPSPKVTTPRMTNLGAYGNGFNNSNNSSLNSKEGTFRNAPTRGYNNSNREQGSRLGNMLERVFNNSNGIFNNSGSSPSGNRGYSPSSSSGGSSGWSRPARGGGN